jgi:uncharacterized HAD superfamily protein
MENISTETTMTKNLHISGDNAVQNPGIMKIGVDFDDVLYGLNPAFATFHNMKYGTNVKMQDIKNFELSFAYKIPSTDVMTRLNEFYADYHESALPVEGALESLRMLVQNYELHVITSRKEELREKVMSWINRHLPNLFKEIHFTNHFEGVGKKRLKSEVCRELGVNYVIEDCLDYAKDVADKGIPVFLLDKPWNQGQIEAPITRVKSWNEISASIAL